MVYYFPLFRSAEDGEGFLSAWQCDHQFKNVALVNPTERGIWQDHLNLPKSTDITRSGSTNALHDHVILATTQEEAKKLIEVLAPVNRVAAPQTEWDERDTGGARGGKQRRTFVG